jgi:autotransporter translocation and assembly factor TamB
MMTDTQPDIVMKKSRWKRLAIILPLLLVGLLFLAFAVLNWLDSPSGQRWLTGKIADQTFKSGLSINIKKIDGSLLDKARVRDVELRDLKGTFLIIHDAQIKWQPGKALRNKIIINRLHVVDAQWLRQPQFNPSDPNEPLLPDFDIDISDLTIDRLAVAPAIAGEAYAFKGKGDFHITKRALRTDLQVDMLDTPDHAKIHLVAVPDDNQFDVAAKIVAERGGALARFAKWQPGFDLKIEGKGDYKIWNGALTAQSETAPLAQVQLHMRSGTLSATGSLFPHPALPAPLRKIIASAPNLMAQGTLERPVLRGSATLLGPENKATIDAKINLETTYIVAAKISVRDAQGQWLNVFLPDAVSKNLYLAADVSGPLRDPNIAFAATAEKFVIAQTQLQQVQAKFNGKVGNRSRGALNLIADRIVTGVAATDDYLRKFQATAQLDANDDIVLLKDLRAASSAAQVRGDVRYAVGNGALTANIRSGTIKIATSSFGTLPATFSGALTQARSGNAFGLAINAVADIKAWRVPPELKRALGFAPSLQGRARLDLSGKIVADQITLNTSAGRFSGSGSYDNRRIDARLSGVITNIKALAPEVPVIIKGAMPVSLVLQGSIDDLKINAEVRSDDMTFGGFRAQNITLQLAPQDAHDWRIGVRGLSDFGAIDGSAIVRRGAMLKLENLQGAIGPASLGGNLVQNAAGLWQGDVRAKVQADGDEKGTLDVIAALATDSGAQLIDFNANGKNLNRRFANERFLADTLQAKGSIRLGVQPTMVLQADAKSLRWKDYILSSLNVDGGGAVSDAATRCAPTGWLAVATDTFAIRARHNRYQWCSKSRTDRS